MKAKLDFKSKRTIIIASIIAVLTVGAGVGGYFYGKGNNRSGATNIDNETSQNSSQDNGKTTPSPDNKKDDKNPDTNPDNGNADNNGEGNGNADNGNTPDNGNNNGNAANNGGTDNGNNGGTNNGNATNNGENGNAADNGAQDAGDDTDATTEESPWESHSVKWTPEALNVSTTDVDTSIPQLQSEKIAYVQGEEIDGTPDNTAVQNGEEITYVIKVKNTGDTDASKVMIYDTVPEGTVLKENAEGTVQTIKDADGKEIQRIVWEKDVKAGETIEVSFKVTVIIEEVEGEEIESITLIENKATVNRKETPKTENPVITSNKVASLVVDGKATPITNDDFVKPGQTIRYTISVKNTSKVKEAITTITDTVPEGTTLIEESLDETVDKTGPDAEGKITLEWKNITVNTDKPTSVSFDVTVNEDAPAKIRNVATVGDTDTPPTENEVYIDITVKKEWDDKGNSVDHPDITVYLRQNGGERYYRQGTIPKKDKKDITDTDTDTYTFTDLPKFDENGKEYEYTISEEPINSYTPEYNQESYTIKNTLVTIDIPVEKIWDDKNITTDYPELTITHPEITVKLKQNGKDFGDNKTLNADNNYADTYINVPEYTPQGVKYNYAVEEVKVVGYDTNTEYKDNKYTITNTIQTTEITGTKVWKDSDNQDGKRPPVVKVELYKTVEDERTKVTDKDVTGSGNNWDYEFTNLPVYENGKKITYSVDEVLDENTVYTKKIEETTITNSYTPETVKVTVKKEWNDKDNQDGIRPPSIAVTLNNGEQVILNAGNGWKETISGLPKYENGKLITYTWTEGQLPEGYEMTSKISADGTEAEGTVTTITNTHIPETTEATIKKVWDDKENQDGKRPPSLTVELSNGETVTLDESNGWTATKSGLPKRENGKLIAYTWKEIQLPTGYTQTGNDTEGTVTTITNSYTPEQTTIKVKKVWADKENAALQRPDKIKVQLYAGTEKSGNPVTLTKDSWEHTYTVDKYKDGKPIVYSFKELDENEIEVDDNGQYNEFYYLAKYSKDEDGTLIVTNTINPDLLIPNITTKKTSSIIDCPSKHLEGMDENEKVITIAHEGDTIRYVVEIKNNGRVPAKVSFEDTINSKLSIKENGVTAVLLESEKTPPTVAKDGNKLSFTDYSLDAGVTIKITIDTLVKNLPSGVYQEVIEKNLAIVKAKIGEEKEQKKSDETEYTVLKPHTVTTKTSKITKCDKNILTGTKVHSGDEIEYTITIHNEGADSDEINTITDTIPEHLTYKPNSLNVSVTSGEEQPQITMTEDNKGLKLNSKYILNAGKTITIKFKVTVDEMPDGTYTRTILKNVVYVNNKPTEDKDYTQEEPKIKASKSVNKEKAEYGEEIEYIIKVKNDSESDIEAPVSISDPIPHGAEYVTGSLSVTVNGEAVSNQGHFDANAGENGTITYETTLKHKGDELILTFKAKITEKTIGETVLNVATINDKPKEAETKVIKDVKVTTKSTKVNPVDLVLVLDVSGSMDDKVNNKKKIDDLKEQSKSLVEKIFPANSSSESTITVITYSSSASNGTTYNYSQKTNLIKTIDNLSANGGTNIYDALDKTINKVTSLNESSDREKIVVFLTDGAATVPNSVYDSDIHSHDNHGDGYTNNLKDPITEKAGDLKDIAGYVYSIGLGVTSLSDTEIGYAEKCETPDIEKNITFDTTNHTFTLTLKNNSNKDVTFTEVKTSIRRITKITELSDDGDPSGPNEREAIWTNVKVGKNETITLTGTYEPETNYGRERTPEAGPIDLTPKPAKICISDGHNEQFNGSDLYSKTKTADGDQYHCITVQDYAEYVLSKISSTGDPMDVNKVSEAFDEIIEDLETTSKHYKTEEGNILEIPETREITGKVKVTIGSNTTEYTVAQLTAGVNGLKYTNGEGFKWTITGNTLTTEKLELEYHVKE